MPGAIRMYLRQADGEITGDETYVYEHDEIDRIEKVIHGPLSSATVVIEFDPPVRPRVADGVGR